MRNTKEYPITPAQAALLKFISHMEADDIHRHLHITLSLAMSPDDPDEGLTPITAQACFFHHELLGIIHAISVEHVAAI